MLILILTNESVGITGIVAPHVLQVASGRSKIEFVIIYVYTIIVTTIIGLEDSDRQKAKFPISKLIKICLVVLTPKKEVPVYFLIIRIFVQLFTIVCFIIVYGGHCANYQEMQIIYGVVMIGVVIPVTILGKIKLK